LLLSENPSLVQLGLENGLDTSLSNNKPIKYASSNGYTETVRLLLSDPRVNPAIENNYPIGMASNGGHTEVVKLLLNNPHVDPSDDDNYAIIIAAEKGHFEIVKLLQMMHVLILELKITKLFAPHLTKDIPK
jgi:ankyrin repeat protein